MYEFMHAVDEYDKERVPMPDYSIIFDRIPVPSAWYKEAPFSLVHTINFISNWL